jgi:PTH1 family peptidyl-tRNA hydrolase
VREKNAILIEPQTYMNASGEPMRIAASFYKIEAPDVLVVVDDLDLPFGRLRVRADGSSGGHNGLKSIIAHFGSTFPRLRIGIDKIVDASIETIEKWLAGNINAAMNFANPWMANPPPTPPKAEGRAVRAEE